MGKRRVLGLIGSILLIIADFSTIVKVPVLGGIDGYLYPGGGSVVLVLVLAITSLIFTLKRKYRALLFTGITSLFTAVLLYIYAATILSDMRAILETEYIANHSLPQELAKTLTMQPVEFQFGGVLLVVGSILTILAAATKTQKPTDSYEKLFPGGARDKPLTNNEKYEPLDKLFEDYYEESKKDKEAIIMELDDEKLWHDRGISLFHLGKHQEAIECFDRVIEINPENIEAWYNKGLILKNLGEHQEAIECFDRVIEKNPEDEGAWGNKGLLLHELGELNEEIICYDNILRINPKDTAAWLNKGAALADLGEYQDAVVCFNKVLEIDPWSEEALLNKGITLGNLGEFQNAIECFDKILKINPNSIDAWFNKGITLHKLMKYQEASTCYTKMLKINPKDTRAWINKGVLLSDLGEYQKAIYSLNKALEIDPENGAVWLSKGMDLYKIGKYKEAITALQNFIKFVPPALKESTPEIKDIIKQLKAQLKKNTE